MGRVFHHVTFRNSSIQQSHHQRFRYKSHKSTRIRSRSAKGTLPDLTSASGKQGAAWMLQGWLSSGTRHEYYMVLAVMALSGALSFFLLPRLARGTIWLAGRCGYRGISGAALIVITLLVLFVTGWQGLVVAWVAAGIGLIPVLFGSRRMNCLGIILLPIACNMSGVGASIAGWLGLL